MNWDKYKELSKRWCEEGRKYAEETNKFVERGMTEGWDEVGKEPKETREDMANEIVEIIKEANKYNEIENLRNNFPPAHVPLIDIIEKVGQAITSVLITSDEKIIFRVGDFWEKGKVFIIENDKQQVIEGALYVGCSYDKKIYAVAYNDYIRTYDGWNGKIINTFNWSNSTEGFDKTDTVELIQQVPYINQLIPFPDGNRVLLVSYRGIFVLTPEENIRIYPEEEYLEEDEEIELSMVHGAVSPDGKYIAIGDQDSNHIILDSNYDEIANIVPESSYPHYALFSKDGKNIIFNSCHFYNGITTQFSLDDVEDEDELENNAIEIDDFCRVYAAVSRDDEYILGDANGYIRAYSFKGEFRWQFYLGSTISGMDISADGKKLLIGTYAGMLHLLELDAQTGSVYSIGTANILEKKRWIIWKGEDKILQW
ncbi:hypothetical protein [Clostridium sp. DJ247]|uniref:hypothetical protein n=1 Tax=Clostridium sp. DJ247 TaxID=2726188 RepID=UPI00162542C0|nr:hypothetical protein [Clostridium sp. DJ247]MBC2582562.1 hypothetical protein [Clostridium sp. DJ247]